VFGIGAEVDDDGGDDDSDGENDIADDVDVCGLDVDVLEELFLIFLFQGLL
jgi:hypothetical protein